MCAKHANLQAAGHTTCMVSCGKAAGGDKVQLPCKKYPTNTACKAERHKRFHVMALLQARCVKSARPDAA